MIAIVLSICLLADPGVCRDQIIPLAGEITPVRCIMNAPPHVAKWSEEHPEWRIVRWRCSTLRRQDI